MDRIRSKASAVEIRAARDEHGALRSPGDAYEAVVGGEVLATACRIHGTEDEWVITLMPRPRRRQVTGEGAALDLAAEMAEIEVARRAGVRW